MSKDYPGINSLVKMHQQNNKQCFELTIFPDDLSSISGSESDSEDGESSDSIPSSVANLSSLQSDEPMKITCCKDDVSGSYPEDEQNDDGHEKKREHLRLMAARHAKVFFENEDGKILSMYRCLLHGKKVNEFQILNNSQCFNTDI